MCDERERLIGYIYDECDADERRTVERHLEGCPTCRAEVQALRGVRADLLAWEVKGSPDVWRPFPAPVSHAWWRQVPAWALAAAAGLVLAAGFGGGVAARALVPVQPTGPKMPPAAVVNGSGPAPVTAADLAEAQERILRLVRFELSQRPASAARPQIVSYPGTLPDDVQRRMTELANADTQNLDLSTKLYNDLVRYQAHSEARIRQLQNSVEQLTAAINQSR